MVKDTCKQERKTQLQQAGILQASEETHAKKGKQTAAAALSARRCRDKAAGSRSAGGQVRLTCRMALGHTPLSMPSWAPSCEHLTHLCPARSHL